MTYSRCPDFKGIASLSDQQIEAIEARMTRGGYEDDLVNAIVMEIGVGVRSFDLDALETEYRNRLETIKAKKK